MPFTPYHLGPGAALKAVTGDRFSFALFGLTQVMIDLEPLVLLVQEERPVHRFFHTYLGATLVIIVALAAGKPLCEVLMRWWNAILNLDESHRFWLAGRIPWLAALTGAVVGAYSHVLLDSIIYVDVQPWAPLTLANGLLGVFAGAHILLFCVGTGIIGGAAMLWQTGRARRAS